MEKMKKGGEKRKSKEENEYMMKEERSKDKFR
jgi:hypothetical protein